MTPAARVAAAIEILDDWLAGNAAEKTLTTWGRRNRYAGSKDRAAIRDLVFQAIRRRDSAAHAGGACTGRGIMIGLHRLAGSDLTVIFSGEKFAPGPIADDEAKGTPTKWQPDMPAWVFDHLCEQHDKQATQIAEYSTDRAPITLRANLLKTNSTKLFSRLEQAGFGPSYHPTCKTAIFVGENERKLRQSDMFRNGEFEFQDAHSQMVAALLPDANSALDFCAGGGGKALAYAARAPGKIFGYDVDPARLTDLPIRAARAGAHVPIITDLRHAKAKFDLVYCDVPCSGSGTWRRSPEAKWKLTPQILTDLTKLQRQVVQNAYAISAPGGYFSIMTCSVFKEENQDLRDWMTANLSDLEFLHEQQFLPNAYGDGLYYVGFKRHN